jgi:hypothetical protein
MFRARRSQSIVICEVKTEPLPLETLTSLVSFINVKDLSLENSTNFYAMRMFADLFKFSQWSSASNCC